MLRVQSDKKNWHIWTNFWKKRTKQSAKESQQISQVGDCKICELSTQLLKTNTECELLNKIVKFCGSISGLLNSWTNTNFENKNRMNSLSLIRGQWPRKQVKIPCNSHLNTLAIWLKILNGFFLTELRSLFHIEDKLVKILSFFKFERVFHAKYPFSSVTILR